MTRIAVLRRSFALGLVCIAAFVATRARAESAVAIGGTLPLSGADAKSAAAFKDGYELAIAEVNSRGGLRLGRQNVPLALTLLDDAGDEAKAASLARQLVDHAQVRALLGTFGSNLVLAQTVVAEEKKVPYLAGSGAATEIFKRGFRWTFGLQTPVKMMAFALLDWISERQAAGELPRPLRLVLATEETSHGKEFAAAVRGYADRKSGAIQLVAATSFHLGQKDLKPVLQVIKDANADVFLADTHAAEFLALHQLYAGAGLCHAVASYGARGPEPEAAAQLGRDKVNYLLSAVWWNEQLAQNPQSTAFVHAFRTRYHRAPDWTHALAYESVRALVQAIEAAGSASPEAVRAQLAAMRMPSLLPSGQLSFPASLGQQAHYPFVVRQNRPDGTAPIIFPSYASTASGIASNPRCAQLSRR